MPSDGCGICGFDVGTQKLCVLTGCGHVFHLICTESWLAASRPTSPSATQRCPLCRVDFCAQTIVELHFDFGFTEEGNEEGQRNPSTSRIRVLLQSRIDNLEKDINELRSKLNEQEKKNAKLETEKATAQDEKVKMTDAATRLKSRADHYRMERSENQHKLSLCRKEFEEYKMKHSVCHLIENVQDENYLKFLAHVKAMQDEEQKLKSIATFFTRAQEKEKIAEEWRARCHDKERKADEQLARIRQCHDHINRMKREAAKNQREAADIKAENDHLRKENASLRLQISHLKSVLLEHQSDEFRRKRRKISPSNDNNHNEVNTVVSEVEVEETKESPRLLLSSCWPPPQSPPLGNPITSSTKLAAPTTSSLRLRPGAGGCSSLLESAQTLSLDPEDISPVGCEGSPGEEQKENERQKGDYAQSEDVVFLPLTSKAVPTTSTSSLFSSAVLKSNSSVSSFVFSKPRKETSNSRSRRKRNVRPPPTTQNITSFFQKRSDSK